jgi:hypothetical protein
MTSTTKPATATAHTTLWKLADANAGRAALWAHRAHEHRARDEHFHERDNAKAAVAFAACALRDWSMWAHLTTRVPLPPATSARGARTSLTGLWAGLPTVVAARGLTLTATPSGYMRNVVRELDDWHAVILTDCPEATARLHARMRDASPLSASADPAQTLTAHQASTAVVSMRTLFSWAASQTGLPAPTARASLDDHSP